MKTSHYTLSILTMAGLLCGSHIAVAVIRWPDYGSAIWGRSRCDVCGHSLSAHELVPIMSALALRGRCRSCGTTISHLHWQIELIGAGIGAAAGLAAPPPAAIAGAIFGWLLLLIAYIDVTRLLLPNLLNAALAASGLLAGLLAIGPGFADRVIGACAGFLMLEGLRHLYRLTRGRDGLGGGDPKLLGAIGAWLGWQPLAWVVLGAATIGLAFVSLASIGGSRFGAERRLPFGAMLATAGFPAWIFLANPA